MSRYVFQNRRWECFKILAAALFLLCSRPLGGILSDSLTYRYGWRNTEYILRLIALLFLIGSVYFIGRRFFRFRRTDYESLLLLGMPDSCVLSWFLFTNLSFFFIQAAFVLLLTDAGSAFWAEAVLSGMVNGLLLSLAAILFIQSPLFSHRKLLLCIGVLFAGLVLYTQKITYEQAREWLVYSRSGRFLLANYIHATWIKVSAALWLLLIVGLLCRRGVLEPFRESPAGKAGNLLGDFLHHTGKNLLCIPACTYLPASYSLERDCQFLYCMSPCSFNRLLKAQIFGGILLIGDNLLVLLLLTGTAFPMLLLLFGMMAFLSVYLNTALYAEYPRPVSKGRFLKIILEMHLPVLNIIKLVSCYSRGKANWSDLRNGKKQYFEDL